MARKQGRRRRSIREIERGKRPPDIRIVFSQPDAQKGFMEFIGVAEKEFDTPYTTLARTILLLWVSKFRKAGKEKRALFHQEIRGIEQQELKLGGE